MKLVKISLTKDATINTAGTIANAGLGLVFFVFLSRFLGPQSFGIFAASQAILVVLADVFDLGTNTGILHFLPKAKDDESFYNGIFKLAILIKILAGLAVFLFGFLLANLISNVVFKNQTYSQILTLSFLILPTLLLGFSTSVLYTKHKFFSAAVLNVISNLSRLALLGILIIYNQVSIFSALLVFSISPFFGFLISPLFFSFKPFFDGKINWKLAKEFLSFNKWMSAAFSTAAVQARIDNLLLIKFSNSFETGIYAAASRLLSIYMQIAGALSTAYAPSFAKASNISEKQQVFKSAFVITSAFAFISLFPVIFSTKIIDIIYGSAYTKAVPSFQILYFGMFFVVLTVPAITAIIYLFSKPVYYFFLTVLQFLLTIIGNIFLIPKYGAVGAALVFSANMLILYSISTVYSFLKLGRN